jgi:hypothetical protein
MASTATFGERRGDHVKHPRFALHEYVNRFALFVK